MKSARPSVALQRQLSTHAAAGLGTLILAFPVAFVLERSGETIGPVLVSANLALINFVLLMICSALTLSACIHTVDAATRDWILVVSVVAGALAGITWVVWVWQMRQPLTTRCRAHPPLD